MSKIGEYIFMGMGQCNGHLACISVGYKLDYCVKKAIQLEKASQGMVKLVRVNKVKVGQLEKETSFDRAELTEYIS
jgi:hypothetical protein